MLEPTKTSRDSLPVSSAWLGHTSQSQGQSPSCSVSSAEWAATLLCRVLYPHPRVASASLGPLPVLRGLLHAQSVQLGRTALPLDHPINSALRVQLVQITHPLDLHRQLAVLNVLLDTMLLPMAQHCALHAQLGPTIHLLVRIRRLIVFSAHPELTSNLRAQHPRRPASNVLLVPTVLRLGQIVYLPVCHAQLLLLGPPMEAPLLRAVLYALPELWALEKMGLCLQQKRVLRVRLGLIPQWMALRSARFAQSELTTHQLEHPTSPNVFNASPGITLQLQGFQHALLAQLGQKTHLQDQLLHLIVRPAPRVNSHRLMDLTNAGPRHLGVMLLDQLTTRHVPWVNTRTKKAWLRVSLALLGRTWIIMAHLIVRLAQME